MHVIGAGVIPACPGYERRDLYGEDPGFGEDPGDHSAPKFPHSLEFPQYPHRTAAHGTFGHQNKPRHHRYQASRVRAGKATPTRRVTVRVDPE